MNGEGFASGNSDSGGVGDAPAQAALDGLAFGQFVAAMFGLEQEPPGLGAGAVVVVTEVLKPARFDEGQEIVA